MPSNNSMVNIIKIDKESGIPLIGVIAFGIIDRGTNMLQVRATTACNEKCPFCSTNANNFSIHPNNYIVDPDYLIEWLKYVIKLKECDDIEVNYDSVGEPSSYQHLIYLISEISKIPEVKKISMQTNGTLLNDKKILELERAGLNRINLSVNTLDPEQAKLLSGYEIYDIEKIKGLAKFIKTTGIELLIAPVWLPKINDQGIIDLIKFCKDINCLIGIQKYEVYKYSRKMKKAKQVNFYKFYRQLEIWEKEFDIRLKIDSKDYKLHKAKRIPVDFEVNEIVRASIVAPGWIKNQMIAVAKNRCITIDNCTLPIKNTAKIKITENKNSIYLARLI
ncbi:MAG: radical SAM protein [Nanoarchaeota archaeon]